MPELTIDGKKVRIPKNATLLDASRKAGTWIPTLCHHPALSDRASCRLCLVEVEQPESGSTLVTACNHPAEDGAIVKVSSDRAVDARRGIVRLLLARCPDSPEVVELAAKMGVNSTPFPKVTESQRNCILCGLCISVCEEVIGAAAISFAGRSVQRAVAPPFRLVAEDCIACGACAALCPVGVIQIKNHVADGEVEISPFKSRVKMRTCESCGNRILADPVAVKVDAELRFLQSRAALKNPRVTPERDRPARGVEELLGRARLCPECRRKRAAESLVKRSVLLS